MLKIFAFFFCIAALEAKCKDGKKTYGINETWVHKDRFIFLCQEGRPYSMKTLVGCVKPSGPKITWAETLYYNLRTYFCLLHEDGFTPVVKEHLFHGDCGEYRFGEYWFEGNIKKKCDYEMKVKDIGCRIEVTVLVDGERETETLNLQLREKKERNNRVYECKHASGKTTLVVYDVKKKLPCTDREGVHRPSGTVWMHDNDVFVYECIDGTLNFRGCLYWNAQETIIPAESSVTVNGVTFHCRTNFRRNSLSFYNELSEKVAFSTKDTRFT